jgi:putative hemolysin
VKITLSAFLLTAVFAAIAQTETIEEPYPHVWVDSIATGRGVLCINSPAPGDRLYAGTAHELLVYAVPGYAEAESKSYPGCISSGICATPDGELLFLGICSPTAGISVLSLPGLEEITRIPMEETPDAMCSDPGGRYIFAVCGDDSTFWRVSTSDFSIEGPVRCDGPPSAVCSSPSGENVYVALEAPADAIQVIDTEDLAKIATWQTGCNPGGICTSPGGEILYLSLTGDDYVASYDSGDGMMIDSVLIGSIPTSITILPDGRYLYTANGMGYSGTVIRTSDMTVAGSIRSGFRGGIVCVSPDGSRVYTASGQDGFIYVTGY